MGTEGRGAKSPDVLTFFFLIKRKKDKQNLISLVSLSFSYLTSTHEVEIFEQWLFVNDVWILQQ